MNILLSRVTETLRPLAEMLEEALGQRAGQAQALVTTQGTPGDTARATGAQQSREQGNEQSREQGNEQSTEQEKGQGTEKGKERMNDPYYKEADPDLQEKALEVVSTWLSEWLREKNSLFWLVSFFHGSIRCVLWS